MTNGAHEDPAAAPLVRGALLLFAVAAVGAWAAAWIAAANFPLRGPAAAWQAFPGLPWLDGWVRWDAMWYVNIAGDGYFLNPGQQSPVAYFPGYPLAIRAAAVVVRDRIVAGIAVTLACGLGSAILFRRWSAGRMDAPSSLVALGVLLAYPFSFFLYGAIYSDALFLLLSLGAFVLMERNRPIWAGLLAAGASGTRAVGLAVAVAIGVRAIERWGGSGVGVRERATWLGAALLGSLGLVAYMIYLGVAFRDPLAFGHAMAAPGWDQPPGPATWFKLTFFQGVVHGPGVFIRLRLLVHAAVALGALSLAWPVWKRFGAAYGVYTLLVILVPAISTKDFVGLGRYAIVAFPCFALIGEFLASRSILRPAWIAASCLAMWACAAAFAVGIYVS